MRFFKEKELCCKCCSQLPPYAKENIEALVEKVLDPLRERYGKPIIVNSAFRCEKHNREVGGAANSQHMRGEAADIRPTTNFTNELVKLAKILVENGKFDQLILYPNFVHVSRKRQGVNRQQILRNVGNGYRPMTRKEVLAL